MSKKILVINGSLRARGNTDTLLASLVEGIKSTDAAVTLHVLRDKKIQDCRGCYFCYENDRCAVNDDMQGIHNDVQNSDLLVLASPLYWWGVSGLMKTFIDRLYLYYPRRNTRMIAGKKAVIFTPMHVSTAEFGEEAYESEIEPLTMTYRYILKRLGVEILDMAFFPGLTQKDDAKKNPAYLNRAQQLGARLHALK